MATKVIIKSFNVNNIDEVQSYFDSMSKYSVTDISITSSGDKIIVALIVKDRIL